VRALASAECRQRRPESSMSSQSSARYEGVLPRSDLKTNIASFKMTHCFTGNQCKRDRTGEMWSRRLVPATSDTTAFWIDCRRRNKLCVAVIEPTGYKCGCTTPHSDATLGSRGKTAGPVSSQIRPNLCRSSRLCLSSLSLADLVLY